MIKDMPKDGSVIVYNKSFEHSRINELAKLYPDLEKELIRINSNMVDFLPPFKKRQIYMKEMQGITKNLSAINASYEMQVKSISSQAEIVESVNANLNKIGSAMQAASAQTEQFKEQATKLTQQVSSLNNVYGNMLNAFGARI